MPGKERAQETLTVFSTREVCFLVSHPLARTFVYLGARKGAAPHIIRRDGFESVFRHYLWEALNVSLRTTLTIWIDAREYLRAGFSSCGRWIKLSANPLFNGRKHPLQEIDGTGRGAMQIPID